MITENLSTLKIHKLTQEQYDRELATGTLDPNAFYLTPDATQNVTDGGAQADWEETDPSAPSYLKNKPFGVPQSEVTVVYSEEGTFNSDFSVYRVGDAPASIYDLTNATIEYYEDDSFENLISGKLYHTIISATDTDEPEDLGEYAGCIVDYTVAYPNTYLVLINNSNDMCFVFTEDTNIEGMNIEDGIWFSSESILKSITYTVYSKINRKFLPDDLGSGGAGGSGGSGAYFLDMTTLVNSNSESIILGDGASHIVMGSWGSGLSSAISSGQPILIKIRTTQTGDNDVYLVGSVVHTPGAYPACEFSGMFTCEIDSMVNVYKFYIAFVVYGTEGVVITTELNSMADSVTSPASNIKYVDFGSNSVDVTAIDYSQYVAGDLILCLTDAT